MKPNQLHSFISCARLLKAFEPCCGFGSLGSRLGNGVWCTGCLLGNVSGIDICGREGKEISLGWRRKRQQRRCHKASADSTESSGTNVTHQSCPAWAKGRLSHPCFSQSLGEVAFCSRGNLRRSWQLKTVLGWQHSEQLGQYLPLKGDLGNTVLCPLQVSFSQAQRRLNTYKFLFSGSYSLPQKDYSLFDEVHTFLKL